jgi:hypothetical protein
MDKYLDSSDVSSGTPRPEGLGLFDVNKNIGTWKQNS